MSNVMTSSCQERHDIHKAYCLPVNPIPSSIGRHESVRAHGRVRPPGTYVVLGDVGALLGVVQRCDRHLGDGDVQRGGQGDQEHQRPGDVLQGQLQAVGALRGQRGQIQLAPGEREAPTHTHTHTRGLELCV